MAARAAARAGVIVVERSGSRATGGFLSSPDRAARACIVGLPGDPGDCGLSPFDPGFERERLAEELRALLGAASSALAPGGVLALYGAPEWVMLALAQCSFEARAWIAVACRPRASGRLARSHALLVLAAERGAGVELSPVRVPHRRCSACGEPLRDWGGRRTRMRADGARLSDVWSDLDVGLDDVLPDAVVGRVAEVLRLCRDDRLVAMAAETLRPPAALEGEVLDRRDVAPAVGVTHGDCLDVLGRLPSSSVDLAFADPPYNLEKPYASARDRRSDAEYLSWCHAWLTEYARVVRPGGTVAVLTLPQWAAAHARFLMRHRALRFDRWVAWDALAEPKGRGLMPAHYALLLFTKGVAIRPSSKYFVADPSAELCRRASCAAARVPAGRVPISDVWCDVPRLRHARHRDAHPCQLPRTLVERVVAVASPPGGVVLDAFCGTGTTGVAARALARRPILADVSAEYVALARRKLDRAR